MESAEKTATSGKIKQFFNKIERSIDPIFQVIALNPKDPIDTFVEMWYQVFLWALFSSMFIHLVAAAVAMCSLRKHPIARWTPAAIMLMGILGPLSGGVVTSAVIAWSYSKTSQKMLPFYAMFAGVIQSLLCLFISFSKIPSTL